MQWLSLLRIQRDLLDTPRGSARFQQYLATMRDANGELRLPLAAFNPMSKGHVAELLDQLLALDAEAVGEQAMRNAVARLSLTGEQQVGLAIADDAKGGWTNRWLFEAKHRFEGRYEPRHGFITALLWSSEPADRVAIEQQIQAAIFRYAWIVRHGNAQTLGQMIRQETEAARFAGMRAEALKPEQVIIVQRHLETEHYPAIIACLYGDEAAEACGYDPLGLPPGAGLRYGLHAESVKIGPSDTGTRASIV
jgi:hypothetical protein